MISALAKRRDEPTTRGPFRTVEGWALGLLLDCHAVRECETHGHVKDRTDPDAWRRAREIATQHPFPGSTPAEAVQAIEDVMRSIGDTCPEC